MYKTEMYSIYIRLGECSVVVPVRDSTNEQLDGNLSSWAGITGAINKRFATSFKARNEK
jgi:hypothetical protein